jgi:rubrerythrin
VASTYEIFQRAERIERTAAELYRLMAENFPWPAEDLALFKRLEQEEIQHAARVRLLASQYRSEPRLFRVDQVKLELMEQMEGWAEELRHELANGRWHGDLEGLKRRVADLEDRCGASHADMLADAADPRIVRFFRDLAAQDRAHKEILLQSVKKADRTS